MRQSVPVAQEGVNSLLVRPVSLPATPKDRTCCRRAGPLSLP